MSARHAILALVVVLTVAPLPDSLAAGRPGLGEYVKAARALQDFRFDEARALIAELEKAAPGEPETRLLAARLAFLDGDYLRARTLLERLDDLRVRPAVRELRPLVEATEETTRGFARRESAHFVISYPSGKDEVLLDPAVEALEAAWREIGGDLGLAPTSRVRIEILPRVADLARVSTLTEREIETSGTIALSKYNKLMLVSPRATVFGYPWLDALVHEYVHHMVSTITFDRAPVWLQEGIAKLEETRWRQAPDAAELEPVLQHALAGAMRKGRLIELEEMSPSLAKLPSQEATATAFAEVFTLADWIRRRAGYAGLRTVLAKVRDGRTARRAVAEVLGSSWLALEADWKKHLRTLDLKQDAGLARRRGARLRFRHGDATRGADSIGLDQIGEEKARRLTRLAGLLAARGRRGAAAAEYEKALAVAPDDPFVGSRLARIYLDLGEPAKAIGTLTPLLARAGDDAYPQTTLGVAYLRTGDPARAEAHLLAAIRISPFDPAVRCGLAEVYSTTGRADRAERERAACRMLEE